MLTSAASAWRDEALPAMAMLAVATRAQSYRPPSQIRDCSNMAFFSRLAILAVVAIGAVVALRVFLRSSSCELPLFSIGQ